jgi:hypothetical protein
LPELGNPAFFITAVLEKAAYDDILTTEEPSVEVLDIAARKGL